MSRSLSAILVGIVVAAALTGALCLAAAPDGLTATGGVRPMLAQVGADLARAARAPLRGWVQDQNLRARDAETYDGFGGSVALSADGRVALVCAPGVHINHQGAAYVFARQRHGWKLQRELRAADAAPNDEFGASVALSPDGQVAVIGAPNKNNFVGANRPVGAAYVFVWTGRRWRQRQELQTPATAWYFGNAVAVSRAGARVLVGAWFANGAVLLGSGAAYVFARSGGRWAQQQELDGSDTVPHDGFGYSVGLSPDGLTAVVATPYAQNLAGAVYVFGQHGSGWRQDQELVGATGARIGQSIAIAANARVMLIGATGYSPLSRAYAYARTGPTWTQTQALRPTPAPGPFGFGTSVALSGHGRVALIGALGTAYVFTSSNGQWQQTQLLRPGGQQAGPTNFGGAVAISKHGQIAVIGAPLTHNSTGATYVFRNLHPPSW